MNFKQLYAILKPIRENFKCYNVHIPSYLKLVEANPHEQIKIENILAEYNIKYTITKYLQDNKIHTIYKITY